VRRYQAVQCFFSRSVSSDLAKIETVSGPGHVAAYPGAEDQRVWAASLMGAETSGGYLVLESEPPLKLHPFRGEGGPALLLGSRDVVIELIVGSKNTAVDLNPGDGVVQWRFDEGHVRLYAAAFSKDAKPILRGLVEGLEVRNVIPPH